jgi:hypothetical protein
MGVASLVKSLVSLRRAVAIRALYYALILAGVVWLSAISATATPAFIYQAF